MPTPDPRLASLLETQSRLREAKSKIITFNKAILWQNNNPVIFPKTINVIQGKAGVHKSRLAETICASLLSQSDKYTELLDFSRLPDLEFAICYVDTERNLSDQLPFCLQQIQIKAGFALEDHPQNFDYISLLEFGREERFDMLNLYLEYLRERFSMHIFIVLDVITDCVFNFNDSKDSMMLIDLMNRAINKYDVTFLCLIHENPGSADKARGHLGTEILNKASTVIQIKFEVDAQQAKTDLIKVSYLKCRSSRKHSPFFATYSDEKQGLELASQKTIHMALDMKLQKAEYADILELLPYLLKEPVPRKELIETLCDELSCKPRTIEKRLKEIMAHNFVIVSENDHFILCKHVKTREISYFLKPL